MVENKVYACVCDASWVVVATKQCNQMAKKNGFRAFFLKITSAVPIEFSTIEKCRAHSVRGVLPCCHCQASSQSAKHRW